MLAQPDDHFINLSKINFAKYVERPNLAKVKFLYSSVILVVFTNIQNKTLHSVRLLHI